MRALGEGHRPAVFLDKDDTLVQDVPYSACAATIRWAPDAFETLARLKDAGYALVLVSNQSGIARGFFTEIQLRRYLSALEARLAEEGIALAATVYCPHLPDSRLPRYRRFCSCRKPNPGMLTRVAASLDLDLSWSWMVGDLLDDVEAGHRAGCRSALLRVHADQDPPAHGIRKPDAWVASLTSAADHILSPAEEVA